MNKYVYIIIRGLRTCTDCDSIQGYVLTRQEATEYCKAQQAFENDKSFMWDWEEVSLIQS